MFDYTKEFHEEHPYDYTEFYFDDKKNVTVSKVYSDTPFASGTYKIDKANILIKLDNGDTLRVNLRWVLLMMFDMILLLITMSSRLYSILLIKCIKVK